MSGRRLRDDERQLWSIFTQKIEPLKKRPQPKALAAKPAASDHPPPKPAARVRAASAVPPPVPPAKPAPPALTPLGRRAKQRVARGRDAIEGRFDLHGLTQEEAHAALARFLRAASGQGARLVLVITGKSGVLRRQVPHWLALPDFREYVIGFESAHVSHGGEGALYIRIRRPR